MKAQITIELLLNTLISIIVITLIAQGIFAVKIHALSQLKELEVLAKTEAIAQKFNSYVSSAYLTNGEFQPLKQGEFGCYNNICYKWVDNTIIAKYKYEGEEKQVVSRTLVYKGVGNEPI